MFDMQNVISVTGHRIYITHLSCQEIPSEATVAAAGLTSLFIEASRPFTSYKPTDSSKAASTSVFLNIEFAVSYFL